MSGSSKTRRAVGLAAALAGTLTATRAGAPRRAAVRAEPPTGAGHSASAVAGRAKWERPARRPHAPLRDLSGRPPPP